MNPNTQGVDVVATSPGNGRLYVFKNPNQAGKSWTQLAATSDAAAVTSLAVADVDSDGRSDLIASTSTKLSYWLTGGGGVASSNDGESWSATRVAHLFTGSCKYDRNETCVEGGGVCEGGRHVGDKNPNVHEARILGHDIVLRK